MKGFIYKITNRVNGKVYIGQTRFTVEHRFKQHLKNYNIEHRKQPLYKAFAEYGIENFIVEPIEKVDCDKLDEREIYWIAYYDSFKNGYNANRGGQGKLYTWTDNQYEEIRNLYLSGFTSQKIAKMFGVSAYTIIGILKSLEVKIVNNPLAMNAVEREEFIRDYKNGYTLKSLADRYNTDKITVKRFLKKHGVDLRERSHVLQNKECHEKIIDDFLNGMKYKDMEEKYHADSRTIKKILVMNGINIKAYRGLKQTIKGAFCLTDAQCLDAIKMYNDKISVKEIAQKFDIHMCTVYELLKRYHVKCNRYNHSKSVQSLNAISKG